MTHLEFVAYCTYMAWICMDPFEWVEKMLRRHPLAEAVKRAVRWEDFEPLKGPLSKPPSLTPRCSSWSSASNGCRSLGQKMPPEDWVEAKKILIDHPFAMESGLKSDEKPCVFNS